MYIGDKEIKKINGEVVEFIDGTTAEYSEDYIEYLSSEEEIGLDELHIKKILKLKSDILKIFVNASATKREISESLGTVSEDIARHEKNLLCNLTNARDYLDINFREVNKLAKEIEDKDFTN